MDYLVAGLVIALGVVLGIIGARGSAAKAFSAVTGLGLPAAGTASQPASATAPATTVPASTTAGKAAGAKAATAFPGSGLVAV